MKTARPATNTSRRPSRSASFPPVSMNAAKLSAYPVTTHSSCESDMPRSRSIDGSATFTTVLSSMIMKSPSETAPSVHHLRCSPPTVPPSNVLATPTVIASFGSVLRGSLSGIRPRGARTGIVGFG